MQRETEIRLPRNRTRTLGSLSGVNQRVRYHGDKTRYNLFVNPELDQLSTGVTVKGVRKTMSDVVTPGFRSAAARGARVNNPMRNRVEVWEPYDSSHLVSWPQNGKVAEELNEGAVIAKTFGSLDAKDFVWPFSTDNLNKVATLETWKRVGTSASQSLVTVAELGKSWDTILDRARKLAKVVAACRRGDVRQLRDMFHMKPQSKPRPHPKRFVVWDEDGLPLLSKRGKPKPIYGHPRWTSDYRDIGDEASRLYLEYRFGWTPLVHDIVDTLKAVYAADLRGELVKRDILVARGRARDEQTVSASITGNYGGLTWTGNLTSKYVYEARGYIHYRWTAPEGIMRRLNDFGLFDVPRAFWELVPFSFLADRLIPVGDWLGALTPKIGVEILDLGHTISVEVDRTQTLTSPTATLGGITYPSPAPVGSKDHSNWQEKERKCFLGVPSFPPFAPNIGVTQMADVAALFKSIR